MPQVSVVTVDGPQAKPQCGPIISWLDERTDLAASRDLPPRPSSYILF